MIPLIDLSLDKSQVAELEKAFLRVLDSGQYILGKRLEDFEKLWAKFIQAREAIGVANGTDALRLSLAAMGIGPGDKVLTVSLTSPFTAIAIVQAGAEPIFCDIDEATLTIDLLDAERRIDKNVAAIVPVHIFGNPCQMDNVVNFAQKFKLKIVEDACQAHGASFKNKKVGTWGDAGAFSFYPTKNLGAIGDAGIIVTNSSLLAKKIRQLRHGGQTRRFWHKYQGINSRMDEVQAAILTSKLKFLAQNNKKRAILAKNYYKRLKELPLKFQMSFDGGTSVYHLFVLRSKKRDNLKDFLLRKKIGCDIYYPYPVHRQPAFRRYTVAQLKVTEKVCREILAIPIDPKLTISDQNYVIGNIIKFFN